MHDALKTIDGQISQLLLCISTAANHQLQKSCADAETNLKVFEKYLQSSLQKWIQQTIKLCGQVCGGYG